MYSLQKSEIPLRRLTCKDTQQIQYQTFVLKVQTNCSSQKADEVIKINHKIRQ